FRRLTARRGALRANSENPPVSRHNGQLPTFLRFGRPSHICSRRAGSMSYKRVAVLIVAVVGLMGSPSVLAAVPAAPTLWNGTIVGADRQPLQAEVVAYARPAGLGLNEGSAPLREIARSRTDGSGRYVLRSLHTEALR